MAEFGRHVRLTSSGAVATIVLDDERRRNALSDELLAGVGGALTAVECDSAIRTIVLTSSGRHFCTGGDIAAFDRGVAAGRDYVYDTIGLFRRIEHLRKPVVAAVRGYALGGGFELVMSSDLVVAADDAQFGLPELSVGAVPAFALVRLGELIGRPRAKELAWSGRRLSATDAAALGLVTSVVAAADVDAEAEAAAARLAALPRVAAELVKAAVNRKIADHALFDSTTTAAMVWGTQAIAEGRQAFYDKRPPRFPTE